jgi:hypothetical protein
MTRGSGWVCAVLFAAGSAWTAEAPGAAVAQSNAPVEAVVVVAPTLREKLSTIILPEIALREAALTNVIEYLVEASRANDASLPADRRGINIVLNVSPADKGRAITIAARRISVGEALKVVCQLAGVHPEAGDAVVMILPGAAGPTMIVKAFLVNQAFLPGIREVGPKAYFAKMGVKFPEGSSITYNAGLGKIVMVNTAENMKTLETLVAGMGGRPAP